MTLWLPPPVSLNYMYIQARGRRVKSPKYREWCELADQALAIQNIQPQGDGPFGLYYQIGMRTWTDRKVPTSTDLDNRIKCMADAIVRAGIIPDDSMKYVKRFSAEWNDDLGASAIVTIKRLGEPQ